MLLLGTVLSLAAVPSWPSTLALARPQSAQPTAQAEDEGHRRMIELLEQVKERTYEDNAILGQRKLRELRAELEAAGDDVPPEWNSSAQWWVQSSYELGLLELNQGNGEAALQYLEKAYLLVKDQPEAEHPGLALDLAYNLGVTCMTVAEDQNCIAMHTSQSCLLPIQAGGVHKNKEGSRMAVGYFETVLRMAPKDSDTYLAARWLLNIAYMTLGEYPDGVPADYRIPPSTFDSDVEFPRFTDVAPALRLNTFSLAGGSACEDYDGDGLLDLFVTTWDTAGEALCFRNQGDGSFEDRSKEAGLTGLYGGLNLDHADYDGDGDVDILILRGGWQLTLETVHPKSLLQNRSEPGRMRFVDVTFAAGLGEVHYPTQTAAWADYDLDGDLDVYVGNESSSDNRCPSQLFQNQGNGTFRDVAVQAGVMNLRFAKGTTWGDIDGDRDPDLYVSNYMQPNRLYLNGGDGHFKDVALERGVARPFDSFPTWFFDYDNDGALDLYVASYYQSADEARIGPVVRSYLGLPIDQDLNKLYQGDGRGNFRDVAEEKGLDLFTVVMGSNFGDLDNDGYLDFYLGTGYPFYDGLVPNVMYWNRRGEKFADVTTAGGFGHLQKGHGVAFADLDGDGDQDIFEEMGGAYPGDAFGNVLFENPGFGNHWIRVRLEGRRSNRSGIGARIRAEITEDGKSRSVYRTVGTGSSFGCNPIEQHLGVGRAAKVDVLEIYWPASDTTQTFRDLPVDRALKFVEGEQEPEVHEVRATPLRK